MFRVPQSWRADYIHLTCTATGTAKGLLGSFDEDFVCGRRKFVVALYAEGDASAKAAAERLLRAESDLIKSISANREALEKRRYPTLAHRMGALFEGPTAPQPDGVAEAILHGAKAPDKELNALPLPAEVRQAVAKYAVARRALFSLGTAEPAAVQ